MSATVLTAPEAVAPRHSRARATHVQGTRVLATASSYVVIYGVTFAFFAPPATRLAAGQFGTFGASTSTFVMLLLAALMVTFGAASFAYSVGWKVESDLRAGLMTEQRANREFAAFGLLIAVSTAAVYLAIMATERGINAPLVGAAAMALVVPGAVAALCTRSVVDHVAGAKRELAATTASAIAVIALTNYLIVGSLPTLAELPQLFGLQ